MSSTSRASVRFAIIAAAILTVFGIAWGTYITSMTVVEEIEVSGNYHALTESVISLAHVAVGDTMFALDPELLEDRINRHRWISEVSVTRWLTGTLGIHVTEREPVTLLIGENGALICYLDQDGFMLPVDSLAHYDVPLLRGVAANLEGETRISDENTLELLQVLAALDTESDDLISDVVLVENSGFEIVTVPIRPESSSIRVRVGVGDYEYKLEKLVAFWEQAVIGHPDRHFEWIDLRFDGQVVTKET